MIDIGLRARQPLKSPTNLHAMSGPYFLTCTIVGVFYDQNIKTNKNFFLSEQQNFFIFY